MKKVILLSISIVLYAGNLLAQQPVSFPSSELQEISQQYAGNSLNWPVVVSLAEHNVSENTFTLSPEAIFKLRNLSTISLEVENQQNRVNNLIENGATIFAKTELTTTNQLLTNYLTAVKNGNLDDAIHTGSQVKDSVEELEKKLNANRLVSVQAQLSEKDGLVDKRIGLLASWEEAFVGDLFEEADGLKTKQESYATLSFIDGSNIIVNPNTTAVIRKSRIDKLDESANTEITLVEGGLLSKLSAIGKERSKYVLNAGPSTTELNTQNFLAENSGGNDVKLSNYDGDAQVTANNVIVTIKKNEGTIIRGNEAPLPPVKLLDAPQLIASKNDTIIYQDNFQFMYRQVPNAVQYNILYSTSFDFDTDVTDKRIANTRFALTNLPLGTTYIKVQSVDNLGLKGPFSETLRIIRNEDTKPPPIFGDQFKKNIFFTENRTVTITGVTEPDARVTIADKTIPVSTSGVFTSQVTTNSNDQIVRVTSTDDSQNRTVKELRIARLTEDYLFDIKLNGVGLQNEIQAANSSKTITGKAYPEMEVELKNGETTRVVKTDSQGRWGVTMSVQEGKLSITFKTNQKSTAILTKSYSVK